MERVDAALLDIFKIAFSNQESALPIIAPIEHDDHFSLVHAAEDVAGIASVAREPEPEDVHGSTEAFGLEAASIAQSGMATIGCDDEFRPNLEGSIVRFHPNANHAPILFDQVLGFSLHHEMEPRVLFRMRRDKVQEIPLGDQGDERTLHFQVREIPDGDLFSANNRAQLTHFLMRQFQELTQQSEFVHELHGGRMNGIAAKVAEEIGPSFDDDHVDTGAGEQESKHHSRGSASGNTAASS